MGETLLQFPRAITGPDGRRFEARVCGAPMDGGMWQGWIEFIPPDGGEPLRSRRETTQPNRTDTEYWATGLTDVYLEGALRRALQGPPVAPVVPLPPQPSVFASPAPSSSGVPGSGSILDPFLAFEKGESMLRRQLGALSVWRLVNIAFDYHLTDLDRETLNRLPAAELIELIVRGVRQDIDGRRLA